MTMITYLKLMRFHKPVGIFLLWFPTAWALWTANQGLPSAKLLIIFFIGTVVMRAAGCVMNDIADRNVDKNVNRTANRPLTSGQLTLKSAIIILLLLLVSAFIILLMLPRDCFYFAVLALAITIIYPFCKRFMNAPQAVLGIAFSMGMPMVFIASDAAYGNQLFILMIINFLWIISYDTMYAMADKKDDLLIGIKSTAIYFADYDRHAIVGLQCLFHFLWLLWAQISHMPKSFYIFWLLASIILVYQHYLIAYRNPEHCLKAFQTNCYYGSLMWLAVIMGYSYL